MRYQYKDTSTGAAEEILIENTWTRDQPKNKENAILLFRSMLDDKELQHRIVEQAKVEQVRRRENGEARYAVMSLMTGV